LTVSVQPRGCVARLKFDQSRSPRLIPGSTRAPTTVIRHVVGAPFRLAARSAQGPVHFPPTWRVMLKRCRPGQPGWGWGGKGGGRGGPPSGTILQSAVTNTISAFQRSTSLEWPSSIAVAELAARCGCRRKSVADYRIYQGRTYTHTCHVMSHEK